MSEMDREVTAFPGQKFRKVEKGLDEAEVYSFIANLMEQNYDLLRKLEHLDSLTRLAEKAVMEAGDQAKSMKTEIEAEAHLEAAAIIAEARDKASSEAEGIIAEAKKKAEESAQQILRAAKEKAEAGKSPRGGRPVSTLNRRYSTKEGCD